MEKKEKVDLIAKKEGEVVMGSLIGVAVVTVIELLGLSALDLPLKVSLYSFAVSIPALTLIMATSIADTTYTYHATPWYGYVSFVIGALASLVGIAGIFFHFSNWVGITFTGVMLLGLAAYRHYSVLVIKINKPEVGADGQ